MVGFNDDIQMCRFTILISYISISGLRLFQFGYLWIFFCYWNNVAISHHDAVLHEEQELFEVELYHRILVKEADRHLPLMEWWQQHPTELPDLSSIGVSMLCIMATSAQSERNFSTAVTVVSKHCVALKPSNVNDCAYCLICLRYSVDACGI